MAAMQSCLRNVFIKNGLRLINNNGVFLQSTRGRHVLVFQMRALKNIQLYKKTKFLSNPQAIFAQRLASTNVTPVEAKNKAIETTKSQDIGATTDTGTSNIVIDESTLPPVPSPPSAETSDVLDYIAAGLKEPPFESLGLGSWWPSGIIQQVLEYLHIQHDLPWWAAIAIVTAGFRILLFPAAAKARRNAVKMVNNLPQLQHLQMKMTEARQTGNYYEAASYAQELQKFMKEKGLNPIAQFAPALLQAPIFISMYIGLKKMVAVPVESMKTGGLLWFEDLTVPDPYYILPVYLAATLFVVIEVGGEGASLKSLTNMWIKYGLRAFPFIILPITMTFPGSILVYWSVSNTLTLCQVLIFKIPAVSRYYGIPKMIKHDKSIYNVHKKGFVEGFKEGMVNMKITKELEDRQRLNTSMFEKAGVGPVRRTFKTSPKKALQAQKQ